LRIALHIHTRMHKGVTHRVTHAASVMNVSAGKAKLRVCVAVAAGVATAWVVRSRSKEATRASKGYNRAVGATNKKWPAGVVGGFKGVQNHTKGRHKGGLLLAGRRNISGILP
jgi:hypothetical protein